MKTRYLVLLPVAMWTAAALSGCDKTEPVTPPPPPEVTVAKPIQKDVVRYDEFTGTTGAVESVEVRARVKGFLQSVEFQPSSSVKAGDLLFVIDPSEYRVALDQAAAELARTKAALQDASWALERVDRLLKGDSAAEREYQEAVTAKLEAEANVEAAEAAVTQAKLNLGYTEVRSPIDGMVSRNLVDAGNLVGAGENTLLTTVARMDPMYAYFNIPERVLLEALARRPVDQRQKPDIPFSIGLVHEEAYPHEGKLDYFDNTVDPTTGTIRVRGVVPNDEHLLFPGAFIRVRVPGSTNENAVLVRESAIGTDLGGKYVFVVDDQNIVEHRPVRLGSLEGGWRVIEEGLRPDERYILNGLQRARPGLPVTPKLEEDGAQPTTTGPATSVAGD
jgi:RND family efflux transporter MFP subunit